MAREKKQYFTMIVDDALPADGAPADPVAAAQRGLSPGAVKAPANDKTPNDAAVSANALTGKAQSVKPPALRLAHDADATSLASLLRQHRQATGLSLREMADSLRIRFVYLEAIEDGRFADLPGNVYAVGFIRSYAEHLGLDPDAMVARFKQEVAAPVRPSTLQFPKPLSENRLPTGAVVVLALILGGFAYGSWYLGAIEMRQFSDLIPEVPERLAVLLDGDGPTVTDLAAAPPAPAPAPDAQAPAPAVPEALGGADPAPTSLPAPAPAPATAPNAPAPVEAGPPATVTGLPDPRPYSPAAQPDSEAGGEAQAVPEPRSPIEGVSAPLGPPAPPVPADTVRETLSNTAPPPPPPLARDTRPVDRNARIVITAVADSWVQIRGADGALIMTRILRSGEAYAVPDIDGLTMVTGNAGGLTVVVDGQPISALGDEGEVVHDIRLDPDALRPL